MHLWTGLIDHSHRTTDNLTGDMRISVTDGHISAGRIIVEGNFAVQTAVPDATDGDAAFSDSNSFAINQWYWRTQVPSAYVCILDEHTFDFRVQLSSDFQAVLRFRLAVCNGILRSWCIQNLSSQDLNRSTESASTTALQIGYVSTVNNYNSSRKWELPEMVI